MMPKAPIAAVSAKGKRRAPQEGLVRASSGKLTMMSALTSVSNSTTLPTPRQRIVHPIRIDSQYVGSIEILPSQIMS